MARAFSAAVSLRPKRGGAGFLGRRLTLMVSLEPLTCVGQCEKCASIVLRQGAYDDKAHGGWACLDGVVHIAL